MRTPAARYSWPTQPCLVALRPLTPTHPRYMGMGFGTPQELEQKRVTGILFYIVFILVGRHAGPCARRLPSRQAPIDPCDSLRRPSQVTSTVLYIVLLPTGFVVAPCARSRPSSCSTSLSPCWRTRTHGEEPERGWEQPRWARMRDTAVRACRQANL